MCISVNNQKPIFFNNHKSIFRYFVITTNLEFLKVQQIYWCERFVCRLLIISDPNNHLSFSFEFKVLWRCGRLAEACCILGSHSELVVMSRQQAPYGEVRFLHQVVISCAPLSVFSNIPDPTSYQLDTHIYYQKIYCKMIKVPFSRNNCLQPLESTLTLSLFRVSERTLPWKQMQF